MQKEFKKEIDTPFSYSFEIEQEGLYVFSVKASCKPGWRNKWWLKFKGFLEDILDLHLDDEDLRLELDGKAFNKPRDKRGFFNSPAAFSGTKTIGKTKTVVIIAKLDKGRHIVEFIPDGSPFLESVTVELLHRQDKFIRYLNIQAEDENYYAWYTFTLIDQQLREVLLMAQADVIEGETDDDDLKVVINGKTQKREENRHPHSYFCGFTVKGKDVIFSKELNFAKSIHYIELFADKRPSFKSIKLILEREKEFATNDPEKKKESFNPKYLLKDAAFVNSDSLSEEEIEKLFKKHGKKHPNHIYHKFIEGRKVAYWIKKFTFEAEVNPRIILAKLQAETGLIYGADSINPTAAQLNWALGVGKRDDKTVSGLEGFMIQLEKAPYLLRQYYAELGEEPFTHKSVDEKPLTVINRATYSLYKYTPHREGANLFYRVYAQLFGKGDLGGEI